MRFVLRRVKRAYRLVTGPRVREAKPATVALGDHEPKASAAQRPIGRFNEGRVVAAAAQKAGAFFPIDDSWGSLHGIYRIADVKAHGIHSLCGGRELITEVEIAVKLTPARLCGSVVGRSPLAK